MKPYCWKICSFPGISLDPFLHLHLPKTKKFSFSRICMSLWWKSSSACCGLNFDATDLPNSSFEPLYPKLFRGTPEVDLVSTVWPPDLPKVRWCRYFSPITLSYNLAYQETILVHPTRRHIFARKTDSTFYKIWDLLISEWRISEIICLESRKKSEETSDQVPIYHQLTQLCKSKRPERGSERTVKRRPWTAAPKASIHEVVLVVNGDHQTGLENIAKVHICLGIFE